MEVFPFLWKQSPNLCLWVACLEEGHSDIFSVQLKKNLQVFTNKTYYDLSVKKIFFLTCQSSNAYFLGSK